MYKKRKKKYWIIPMVILVAITAFVYYGNIYVDAKTAELDALITDEKKLTTNLLNKMLVLDDRRALKERTTIADMEAGTLLNIVLEEYNEAYEAIYLYEGGI